MLRDRASRISPREIATSSWLLGGLIALVTWEPLPLAVGAGLDPSAVNAVNLAADLGLDHGTEIAWTYGPLGFLEQPSVAGGWTATVGTLFSALLRVALASSLVWAARRSFALLPAALLSFAVCAVTGAEVVALSLTVVWCLVAFDPERPPWARPLVAYGGGVLSAVEVLTKLNVGVAIAILCLLTVATMPGPRARSLAEFGASALATAAVLWLATGQGLANVDDFVAYAVEIVSGYSAAMGVDAAAVGWGRVAGALIVAAALAGAWLATRGLSRRSRLATVAIVAALCFVAAKQGIVREDVGHARVFVGALAAPWLALRWERGARVGAAAAVVVISLLSAPLTGRDEGDVYRPLAAAGDAVDQLRVALDPGPTDEDQRLAAQTQYALDPLTLDLLLGRSVHVDPWETSIVWAYDLAWEPLPVFQSYAAYTPELDRLNAEVLASPEGPDVVLRHLALGEAGNESIDGRYGPYDAPATTGALLCNFAAVRTTDRYQVLQRRPNRCGEPVTVKTVSAAYDQPIAVPAAPPGTALFARIEGMEPSGAGALRPLLYKGAPRVIGLDDRAYRLIAAPAENGLLISAPATGDFPAPFALAPNPTTIAFGKDDGFGSGPDTFEVSFYAVGLEPAGGGA